VSELPDWRPPADPLPDELATLGARLEAAAAGALHRRRRLRRSILNGAVAAMVGAPLALAAAATTLGPSDSPNPAAASASAAAASAASAAYEIQHLPDMSSLASVGHACVIDPDCRAPGVPPSVPARLRILY
jgi:hypothetical protein